MANRPQTLIHHRSYSRTDFTALRAFVQRVPPATIARLYFSEDENGEVPTATFVERYLRAMQADLVTLAIEHGSSVLAEHLKASTRQHGSARLTAVTLQMVEQAASMAVARPQVGHALGVWFKPLVSARLKQAGLATLGDLIDFCNRRGGSWWRSVPRIGAGRARLIVSWLRQNEATLGARVNDDVVLEDPLYANGGEVVVLTAGSKAFVPLERMRISGELSGMDGTNRAQIFPYISARHDLDAVRAYLHQYREQPEALRAYTKELERFVWWAVCVRGKAMSSLLVDDCEAYKDFIEAPALDAVGPRVPRKSGRWRPFASKNPSPESRRYAVIVLRAAFSWLVEMRYLAGNPWKGVKTPKVVRRQVKIRVERALPGDLWGAVREFLVQAAGTPDAVFWRIVIALSLLMGDSGLRRAEAASATRERLIPSSTDADGEVLWELTVIGKGMKERTVPVSADTIDALRAHWHDRGLDFDAPQAKGHLIAPVMIPRTPQALRKHGIDEGSEAVPDKSAPYSVDVLNQLMHRARTRLIAGMPGLSADSVERLSRLTPHSLRHTFATLFAEEGPIDVLKSMLGHASLDTTTIYVNPEKKRMMAEAGRFYSNRRRKPVGEAPT